MHTRRSQIYLAHSRDHQEFREDPGDDAAGMEPEDAAEYISALLSSLRAIAVKAELPMLSDLLYVAEEEAKLHCRI